MPKIKLTDEQVGELIDLLHAEIDRVRTVISVAAPHGPDDVEMRHKEDELLELLEILEDA